MIIWRKNKSLLSFDGEKASDVIKDLCQLICTDNSEVPTSDYRQSSKSSDISADIESLKLGQQVNGEAIQTLSDSILYMTSVISQLQVFLEKYKKDLGDATLVKATIMNEHIESGAAEAGGGAGGL